MYICLKDRYGFSKKENKRTKNSTSFNGIFHILGNLEGKVEYNNYQNLNPSSINSCNYPNNIQKVYFTAILFFRKNSLFQPNAYCSYKQQRMLKWFSLLFSFFIGTKSYLLIQKLIIFSSTALWLHKGNLICDHFISKLQ